ncbi:hypothetical protein PHMEG_00017003 [Phytophthora megakarya]|uniref:Uncharacterized protein n=1 Tax=Phytophthora megakarya TaxID=4795 RepID=A0A225VXT5_9STRA|nr:hypothetical protein PHMEG_00017003 [Phytophthora megakarya]
MLKEVVSLLSLFSPRLCRLIGQVWDLASLNVFVLLHVVNTALQEAQQLRDQLAFTERLHGEGLQQQTVLVQRYEDELARHRVDEQGLRAELQKVRQRANRFAVENGQLHLVVSRVLDAQAAMEATRYDSSNPTEQLAMQESDGPGFCEDIAAVGDVEERELYGVGDDEDTLTRIEIVHPIESYATDFEQLFQALLDGEKRNVRMLNEMDRFINSTAVALLWRYGSTEEEHQMMHRMLSASTVATQTDAALIEKPSRVRFRSEDHWESEESASDDHISIPNHPSIREENEDDELQLQSPKHEAVKSHQIIPPTLRAQLDSRPRVQRILEKSQLNRILLRLYLEKLECDAHTLRHRITLNARATRSGADPNGSDQGRTSIAVVRTPLHRFMKEFFLERYEVPALADFHMMEVVKSCLYYHEKLNIVLRRGAVFTSTALVGCLSRTPENLVQHHQHHDLGAAIDQPLQEHFQQHQFVAADIRVALFSRLCELVPFDTCSTGIDNAGLGGNLSACLVNAVVDVLGDVLELDPAVPSLAAVEEFLVEESWGVPRALATELLPRHVPFVGREILDNTKAQVACLAPVLRPSTGDAISADCIAVDVFLALFATAWISYDQQLENKLRESFRQQLLLSSPFARKQADTRAVADNIIIVSEEASQPESEGEDAKQMSHRTTRRSNAMLPTLAVEATAIATHSTPLELITQAWLTLANETLSSLDIEELESTFRGLLEAKKGDGRHRQSVRQPNNEISDATGPAISLGGVSEKEFVFHTLQVLRRRRNNYGLRTNSRCPPHYARYAGYGNYIHEKLGSDSDEMSIPLDSLKPGLNSDSLAYVSK